MITQERLKYLFWYDPSNGSLVRKVSRQRVKAGEIAGSITQKGYLRSNVDGRHYMNHILVWIMHYGYRPEMQIDHINRIKTDNRIENLRLVDNRENCCNKNNHTSGYPGVDFHKKSNLWRCRIRVKSNRYSLGYYKSAEIAGNAHKRAAKYVRHLICMLVRI